MAIEKNKIPVGRLGAKYQLDGPANPAHLPQKWAKLAKLAKMTVMFSW